MNSSCITVRIRVTLKKIFTLTLEKFNIDPAIASSIFLTMCTDSLGFFAFLGLATLFLL